MSDKKGDFYSGSICLSDIPKELITNHANGKQYLNIAISSRKEKGKFGETHNVIASIPKDQRKEGDKPIYIGNLKEWQENGGSGNAQQVSTTASPEDDLPF